MIEAVSMISRWSQYILGHDSRFTTLDCLIYFILVTVVSRFILKILHSYMEVYFTAWFILLIEA